MDAAAAKIWIELIASASIPIAVVAVIIHRIERQLGIGVRAIQYMALAIIVPLVLILALEGILERSAVGALIGALVGYLFSNIGKYDERKASKEDA
jgi:hypothetical protein